MQPTHLPTSFFDLEETEADHIPAAAVSTALIASWNPLSGLGSSYTSTLDQLHVYYTGTDTKIYEFLQLNVSTTTGTWNAQSGHNHIWASADYIGEDITAVGWLDQVRFYQVNGDSMVQGSLSGTIWTETFLPTATA